MGIECVTSFNKCDALTLSNCFANVGKYVYGDLLKNSMRFPYMLHNIIRYIAVNKSR